MVLNIYRQVAFCSSVSRYFDIPIVGFHRQVAPRNQLPVLVDDNVLSILFTPGPYLDVACFGFRLAMYRYHTVIRAQGNIPFCRNCFHIRAVVADPDISFLIDNIYAAIIRYHSFYNIYCTLAGLDRNILICLHIAVSVISHDNIPGTGLQVCPVP